MNTNKKASLYASGEFDLEKSIACYEEGSNLKEDSEKRQGQDAKRAAVEIKSDTVPTKSSKDSDKNVELGQLEFVKFPVKLMKVLDRPDISSIRWLSCGRGFEIVAPETFANVTLQQHFQHVKLASFIRRLNRWGFRQLSRKKHKNQAFHHPKFQRGRKDLCSKIICLAKIDKRVTIQPTVDTGRTHKIMPDLRGRIIPYEQIVELNLQGRNAMSNANTFVNHTNQSNPQLLTLKSNVGALLSQTALNQQFQSSQGNEMLGTELDLRLRELAQNRLLSQGRLIQQNTQFPVSRSIPQNAFSGPTSIQNTLLPVDVLNTHKATSQLLGMQSSPQRQFSAISAIPQRNVGINEEVPIVSALQNLRDTFLLPNSSRLQSPHDALNVLPNENFFSARYF